MRKAPLDIFWLKLLGEVLAVSAILLAVKITNEHSTPDSQVEILTVIVWVIVGSIIFVFVQKELLIKILLKFINGARDVLKDEK